MSRYTGRLWLARDTGSKLRVEIQLKTEAIRVVSNDVLIGDWPLSDVDVRTLSDTSVRLRVEGEDVIVSSQEREFVSALVQAAESQAAPADRSMASTASPGGGVTSFAYNAIARRSEKPGSSSSRGRTDREAAVSRGWWIGRQLTRGAHQSRRPMLWKW